MDVWLANGFEPERGTIGFEPEQTERRAGIELTEFSGEGKPCGCGPRRNPFGHGFEPSRFSKSAGKFAADSEVAASHRIAAGVSAARLESSTTWKGIETDEEMPSKTGNKQQVSRFHRSLIPAVSFSATLVNRGKQTTGSSRPSAVDSRSSSQASCR